jgi:hypothetical protein
MPPIVASTIVPFERPAESRTLLVVGACVAEFGTFESVSLVTTVQDEVHDFANDIVVLAVISAPPDGTAMVTTCPMSGPGAWEIYVTFRLQSISVRIHQSSWTMLFTTSVGIHQNSWNMLFIVSKGNPSIVGFHLQIRIPIYR